MSKPHRTQVASLCLLAVLLAVLWLPAPGTTDVPVFLRWAAAAQVSVRGSYAAFSSYGYPPLGFAMLRGAGWIAAALHTSLFTGFKVSLLLCLLATAGLFWRWTRHVYLSLGLFLALLPNSMTYGYTDIYFAVFLVGALWALYKDRLVLFTLLYCAACLVKWQPLVLAPLVLIYLLGTPSANGWRAALRRLRARVLLPAGLVALGTLLLFGRAVLDALTIGLSNAFLSGQALNLNWIVTFAIRVLDPGWLGGLTGGLIVPIDTPDWHVLLWSKLLFWLAFIPVCLAFALSKKSYDDLILFGLCGYLTYCMFNVGVHENHWFIAVLLAAVLAWRQRAHLATFALWALLANLNLFIFYGADGSGLPFSRLLGVDLTLPLAVLFVALFAVFYYETVGVALIQLPNGRLHEAHNRQAGGGQAA